MKIELKRIEVESQRQLEFMDITDEVEDIISNSGVKNGYVLVFSPHTTGGITLNHNEAMLIQDMTRILHRLVPIDERYSHDMFELSQDKRSDGRSNGHSHCKNIILGVSEYIPIENGKMILGQCQDIFFVELDGARKRQIVVQVIGE